MRLLIDTHVLIWAMDGPTKLSTAATAALRDPDNDLLLSAATIWEMAIKIGQGKLTLSLPYRTWMDRAIVALDLTILPLTVEYAERLTSLPPHHKDPFDRLIIAQALIEKISVICADPAFDLYGTSRVW